MNRSFIDKIRRLALNQCEYCHMPADFDPLPFQVDHIIAEQHGGTTTLANLAWSCLHCNKHKGPNVAGIDPVTYKLAPLFHPRRQNWERHFFWEGPILCGRTLTARATIRALAINHPHRVDFRGELLDEGVYFPLE